MSNFSLESYERLSIVAKFDELRRQSRLLTQGVEDDFLTFTLNQEQCRLKWLKAEEDAADSVGRLNSLSDQNLALQAKLKHARGGLDNEMKKRKLAERERDNLERQIALVRDLLMSKNGGAKFDDHDREKLAFLSAYQPSRHDSPDRLGNLSRLDETMLSDVDISYDKTEEDPLNPSVLRSGRPRKRPSAPPLEDLPLSEEKPKRRRRKSKTHRRSKSAVVTTTVTMEDGVHDTTSGRKRKSSPRRHETIKKYHSERDLATSEDEYKREPLMPPLSQSPTTPNGSPVLRHYNSASKGLNRPHIFQTKTTLRLEMCAACGKRIGFAKVAVKCQQCKSSAHQECKDKMPLPCIPTTANTGKKEPGVIADYAPFDPPMIPALVFHCVKEVEKRGLTEIGIYRVPGSREDIRCLKEKFLKGRGTPNLNAIHDINVICSCLKDFLRNLKEPLVTYDLWRDFYKAAATVEESERESLLYQAISQLPQPNRDTLAFMILHLQEVGATPECKMPLSSLATVFGPTIIQSSSPDLEPTQMIKEMDKQVLMMEALLGISGDYWSNFITVDENRDLGRSPYTPEVKYQSMLGPVGSNVESIEKKTWSTPRYNIRPSTMKKSSQFFSSPFLK